MALLNAAVGFSEIESSHADTSTAGADVVTGAANTKGSYTQLIASTARESYGIYLMFNNAVNLKESYLADIALGTTVLIPNLMVGNAPDWLTISPSVGYYFPVFIPAGSQLQCRAQSLSGADTVRVAAYLFQRPIGPTPWFGTRVTDYGTNTGTSGGTKPTAGNNAYGTAAQLSASTTNPIKFMQLGFDAGGDTTLSDYRVYAQVMQGASQVLAKHLICTTDANEYTGQVFANAVLGRMGFDFPAGIDLRVALQVNGTTNNVLGVAVYGVD